MSKSEPDEPDTSSIDFWQLFRELPESYLLFEALEPDYRIMEVNRVCERLLGARREDSIGRPLFEVFPDDRKHFQETSTGELREYLRQVVRTSQPKHLKVFRYDTPGIDGRNQIRYWQSSYLPVKFRGSVVSHILAVTRDVTENHAAVSRINRAEERMEAALHIGKVGSWVWDLDTNLIVADATMAKMFGVSPAAAAKGRPVKDFMGVIHADDVDRVNAAIETSIRQHSLFEEEYRTTDGSGRMHWVIARAQLQEQNGRRTFPGVLVDITERRDLQAQVELARRQDRLNRQGAKILQDRNDELEAIARTKDEFVALASHQLRTPATAVKQYLGMVLQGYVGDISEVQTEMLEKAFESNERQIEIINQILNAARADTGRLLMSPVPIDLRSLVQGIANDMRASFDLRQHSFTLHLPQKPMLVNADLGYLRMAIENVVHNACIYTPDGGKIAMRLGRAGNHCLLSVTDNGVGIKKADVGRLFAKFSRIHNPLSVAAGGSGIGLYLAAEIIRLHGGSIEVESKIHQGTTFAISIPLMQTNS